MRLGHLCDPDGREIRAIASHHTRGGEKGQYMFACILTPLCLSLEVPDVRGRHAAVDAAEGAPVQVPPRRQLLGRPLRQGDRQRRKQQIRLLQVSRSD